MASSDNMVPTTPIGGNKQYTADLTVYDYSSAGFDDFLQRTIGTSDVGSAALTTNAPDGGGASLNFDSVSASGNIGDQLNLGRIMLDGKTGRISVYDTNGQEVVRLGSLDD